MDAVITSLISAAPIGAGSVLLIIIALLIRREAQLESRHAAELTRITAAHDAELAELREEIKGLRQQVDDLNTKLDAERDRRRAAEDRTPPWPN